MAKIIALVFFSLTISSSFSQDTTSFKLNDTAVLPDKLYSSQLYFWNLQSCSLNPDQTATLDSLVSFLNANSNLGLHITRHEKVNARSSSNYCRCRAEEIKRYLVSKGVAENRLTTEGNTIYVNGKLARSDFEDGSFKTTFKTFLIQ